MGIVLVDLSLSAVKMAELLAIKRELTVIKVQIDGLLDCVDQMDRQRKECSGRDVEQLDDFLSLAVDEGRYRRPSLSVSCLDE